MKRTKEALRGIWGYNRSHMRNIFQAYKEPSSAKINAFEYCERLCEKYNGYGLKIVSKNTFQFSVGFLFDDDNEQTYFCYITANYDRYYPLSDTHIVYEYSKDNYTIYNK